MSKYEEKIKKKLLIVAPFCSLPGELRENRFLDLSFYLSEYFDVTLVTSSFRHSSKTHRKTIEFTNIPFEIVTLYEPGYNKNVSLSRVFSHKCFVKHFGEWFKNREFDIVYSAFPLIETNVFLIENQGRSSSFKLVIDIQDIWPESISAKYPIIERFKFILSPFSRKANYVYRNADGIVAVSHTYLERALEVNDSVPSLVAYIGSPAYLDALELEEVVRKEHRKLKLVYIGSLGQSYDIMTVCNAAVKLKDEIELHILGEGDKLKDIENLKASNIHTHGLISYRDMIDFLLKSDVAVNSLKRTAKQSITNKLSDYLRLGLPILNSQNCPEAVSLMEGSTVENYEAGDIDSCIEAINNLRKQMSKSIIRKPRVEMSRSYTNKKIYEFLTDI